MAATRGGRMRHYRRPGWLTRHVLNPLVAISTRLGAGIAGSHVLEVRGRTTGEWRRTPVNPVTVGGHRYLVAPRGNTQWVRNLRKHTEGRLLAGRRVDRFMASEVADGDKPPVLRAYLRRWSWEVGAFFGGVGADASDDELLSIAADHPVFLLEPLEPSGAAD